MSKAIFDGRRYICRETVKYKGQTKRITGSSVKGKLEAKKSFSTKVDEWKYSIDHPEEKEKSTENETLSTAILKWYDIYKRPKKQERVTVITDLDTIKQLLASDTNLSEMPIQDITSDDIQKNLNKLAETKSDSIIKKRFLILKMFFKYYAITHRTFNIMEIVQLPKSQKKKKITSKDTLSTEKLAYTDEEINLLYNHLKKPFDKTKIGTAECGTVYGRFLLVILFEYLRFGEATELRVKDIDFKKNVIHVRRQWATKEKEIRKPKYNSVRDVPIAKEIRVFLVEACMGKHSDDLVFRSGELNKNREYLPSSKDGHIRENVVLLTLHRAEDFLHLPRHTIHDLRHDGISLFVRRGLKAEDVSRFAGHKSVAFTMERYYRHTNEISDEAMRLVAGDMYEPEHEKAVIG